MVLSRYHSSLSFRRMIASFLWGIYVILLASNPAVWDAGWAALLLLLCDSGRGITLLFSCSARRTLLLLLLYNPSRRRALLLLLWCSRGRLLLPGLRRTGCLRTRSTWGLGRWALLRASGWLLPFLGSIATC